MDLDFARLASARPVPQLQYPSSFSNPSSMQAVPWPMAQSHPSNVNTAYPASLELFNQNYQQPYIERQSFVPENSYYHQQPNYFVPGVFFASVHTSSYPQAAHPIKVSVPETLPFSERKPLQIKHRPQEETPPAKSYFSRRDSSPGPRNPSPMRADYPRDSHRNPSGNCFGCGYYDLFLRNCNQLNRSLQRAC